MAAPAALLVAFGVFPLWVAAGLADWACHRSTAIERTSGLRENLFHLAMFAQMGVAVLAVALLAWNAAVLALLAVAIVLHELTVWVELRYTVPRREVRPLEQVVHSFQELLPLCMLAMVAAAAWEQALALVGLGAQPPDWALRWQPAPAPLLAGGAAAVVLFNAWPLAQETRACLRARRAAPAR